METFSHFEILSLSGERVVEGHKASFCLEDNDCSGVDPHYDCENYGDQVKRSYLQDEGLVVNIDHNDSNNILD